ncbi:acyloxyacyl hydrolase [Alkalitalea saponilacus]|uniref:Lipid A 3-O-deacylase (PagL) n=1 Tax=Alkalitalea saponilacus TaxID=889453 RepID=A0A1T5EWL5_9BACT|nr:acyloxyacyl hydrolase [Alkalitalea saponilacus]ASB47991.1 deacylase [Alkalitalea saponilacus]SKB88323.1 Lipid A 3-O-deacylase (PagL) [Alkalitalea saponilacus]
MIDYLEKVIRELLILKKNVTFFFIAAFLISADSEANNDSTFYSIEARYHYGIVIPHHSNMAYFISDYASGVEINLNRRRFGSQIWESKMGYPETGIGFWFSTLGEPNIYGNGYAIYPYINFNLFDLGNLNARYRVALGLGYADTPYDKSGNLFNNIFGSYLNAYIGLGLHLSYPVSNRINLRSTLSLNHMSNGSSRKPNHGLNTAAISFGATYHLSTQEYPRVLPQTSPRIKAREIVGTLSAGRNQAAPYPPDIHWSGSLTLTHLWYQTENKAYGLGLDFIRYGGAPLAFIKLEEMDFNAEYGFSDYFYTGITGTMESHLGATALYITAGAYVHYKTEPRQPVYARLGIRQKIYENLLGHFGIKANFFTAEFIEFGMGYRFRY